MSATDVLRRLLDERGVEWVELVGHPVVVGTAWYDRDGCSCAALEHADDVPDGMLSVHVNLTPAQAIAATLGDTDATGERQRVAGTCHITDNGPWGYPYVCSACGASFDPDVNGGEFNYCPNCGRRIEQ